MFGMSQLNHVGAHDGEGGGAQSGAPGAGRGGIPVLGCGASLPTAAFAALCDGHLACHAHRGGPRPRGAP